MFDEGGWTLDTQAIEEHKRDLLARRLAGLQEKYPDIEVTRVVATGRPSKGLLDYPDRAQLVVVLGRGRSRAAGSALGSTSQGLISYALCPVVVARGTPLR
ncbi:universal stress protein [Amycolatopsis sp. NPDC004368]